MREHEIKKFIGNVVLLVSCILLILYLITLSINTKR